MKKTIFFTLLVSLSMMIFSFNQGEKIDGSKANVALLFDASDAKAPDKKAQKFVEEASSSGMMEVQLGELATSRANSQEVKDFGQRMVNDHSKANEELKSIAQNMNLPVSDSLMQKHQRMVDQLQEVASDEFDQEYMAMMVEAHQKDVEKFEKAQEDIDDEALKNFIVKTLPVLREHLEMAQNIQSSQ